jgi:hypothetical protein
MSRSRATSAIDFPVSRTIRTADCRRDPARPSDPTVNDSHRSTRPRPNGTSSDLTQRATVVWEVVSGHQFLAHARGSGRGWRRSRGTARGNRVSSLARRPSMSTSQLGGHLHTRADRGSRPFVIAAGVQPTGTTASHRIAAPTVPGHGSAVHRERRPDRGDLASLTRLAGRIPRSSACSNSPPAGVKRGGRRHTRLGSNQPSERCRTAHPLSGRPHRTPPPNDCTGGPRGTPERIDLRGGCECSRRSAAG